MPTKNSATTSSELTKAKTQPGAAAMVKPTKEYGGSGSANDMQGRGKKKAQFLLDEPPYIDTHKAKLAELLVTMQHKLNKHNLTNVELDEPPINKPSPPHKVTAQTINTNCQ